MPAGSLTAALALRSCVLQHPRLTFWRTLLELAERAGEQIAEQTGCYQRHLVEVVSVKRKTIIIASIRLNLRHSFNFISRQNNRARSRFARDASNNDPENVLFIPAAPPPSPRTPSGVR